MAIIDIVQAKFGALGNLNLCFSLLSLFLILFLIVLWCISDDWSYSWSWEWIWGHFPDLYPFVIGNSIGFASSNNIAFVVEKQDISFKPLVGPEVEQLIQSYDESWLSIIFLELRPWIVVWQIMLSFLFGHLVVYVIVRIDSVNSLKARVFTNDLLFAFRHRLNSLQLNSIDNLAKCTRQDLKLKNAEEISYQSLAIGCSLRTNLSIT